MLLNLLNEHLLHFIGAYVVYTFHGFIELLAVDVGLNCLLKEANLSIDLSSSFDFLDVDQTLAEDLSDFSDAVLAVVQGYTECLIPNLFKLFGRGKMCFRNFKVPINGLLIIA